MSDPVVSSGRIGPYALGRELARGATGIVYEARGAGGPVALKLVTLSNETVRARFRREAEALKRVRHAGIVQVVASGELERHGWLALELVTGRTIEERVRREGALAPRVAATLTRALADAIAHAHAHDIVHRDVKPSNVLLRGEEPVLVDFSLALDLDEQQRLTQSGLMLGTPGYWAPEQANGQTRDAGPSVDVHGLGATLYFMLTGHAPYEGGSLFEVIEATVRATPTPPSRERPMVDRELEALCLRSLAADPAARFASAADLRAALDGWLARSDEARSWRGAAGALLLGALAVGVAATAWAARPAVAPPTAVVVAQPVEVIAPVVAAGARARGRAEEAVSRARLCVDARDWPGVEAAATEALTHDPGDVVALCLRAGARRRTERFAEAALDVERAMALGPEQPLPWVTRGQQRWTVDKDVAGARADFTRALELDPDDHDALRLRAKALMQLGDYVLALDDLERASKQRPGDPALWTDVALTLEKLGRREAVITAWTRTLERDPSSVRALEHRAKALHVERRYAEALADLDRALELAPDDVAVTHTRAVTRNAMGNSRGAIADYDRVLVLDPDYALYVNRGNAYKAAGDLAAAIVDYTRAITRGERAGPARLFRADCRLRLGERDAAVEDLREALRLLPPGDRYAAQAQQLLDDALAGR